MSLLRSALQKHTPKSTPKSQFKIPIDPLPSGQSRPLVIRRVQTCDTFGKRDFQGA